MKGLIKNNAGCCAEKCDHQSYKPHTAKSNICWMIIAGVSIAAAIAAIVVLIVKLCFDNKKYDFDDFSFDDDDDDDENYDENGCYFADDSDFEK